MLHLYQKQREEKVKVDYIRKFKVDCIILIIYLHIPNQILKL